MFKFFRLHAFVLLAGLMAFVEPVDAMRAGAPAQQNSVSYITGGIGQTEVEAFRAQAHKYNLRMIFTTKTGSFLSDVDVSIWSTSHQRILRVRTEGPLLFVRLAAGHYRIEVHLRSQSATQVVNVTDRSGTEVVFRLEDPDKCDVMLLCGRTR